MDRSVISRFLLVFTMTGTILMFAGCSSEEKEPAGDSGTSSNTAGTSDMEKMKAELAKLSPADAASAEKQHICPVRDAMLGTMGAPIKVDVNGREVWICCEGCREKLLDDPDTYLANLNND